MDVLSICKNEPSRKSAVGENQNIHIAYKNSMLEVSEMRTLTRYRSLYLPL